MELLMSFSSITIAFNDFDVSNLGSRQASQVVDSFDELPVDFMDRKVSVGEYIWVNTKNPCGHQHQ